MTKSIFITATGTDVGKTYVSALIVKSMREAGFNCGYFKPVLSGGMKSRKNNQEHLIKSDANYVVDTAKVPSGADDCVAYSWEEPLSPHLAAKRTNQKIETTKIKNKFNALKSQYDYLLVEGAGGITCPLDLENGNKYLLKDLIKELDLSIIIIADGGLGTINSTLLTVDYAKSNGIKINGIILNNFEQNNFMHQDNLKQVEYLTGIKVVATVEKNQTEIKLLKDIFED